MPLKKVLRGILPPAVFNAVKATKRALAYQRYLATGGSPFGVGYSIYRKNYIGNALHNGSLMARFANGEPLPSGYGIGLDERSVEYPWAIGQLAAGPGSLLDAGSTLNHGFLIDLPILRAKAIDVLTLAPEEECFWQRRISYLFHDLRNIPVRDDYYDTVVCLSTLEHVGCDNSRFTGSGADCEDRPGDYIIAIKELCRVLKPGGSLLITVPFGAYCHLGVQQQFDRGMLARTRATLAKSGYFTEAFYRYAATGWDLSTETECADSRYVESAINRWAHHEVSKPAAPEEDHAVAARAVACLRLNKNS